MELIDSLCELENLNANHHGIMALSTDSFTTTPPPPHHQQQPQLPAAMSNFITDHNSHNIPRFSHSQDPNDHHVLMAHPTALTADFGEQGEKEKVILGTGLICWRFFHVFRD